MIFLPLMLLWAPRPMRFTASARWALMLVFAAALSVGAPDCLGVDSRERDRRGASDAAQLQREGTRVSGLVGTIREVGRRWTFTAEEGQAGYRLLENQALERVSRAIQEEPQDVRWRITGELTEYMDENFLLLRHAERAEP